VKPNFTAAIRAMLSARADYIFIKKQGLNLHHGPHARLKV
jgi:hypothetical protein